MLPRNASEMAAYLAVLIAALTMIVNSLKDDAPPVIQLDSETMKALQEVSAALSDNQESQSTTPQHKNPQEGDEGKGQDTKQ